jgi:asparagine synthase (glutamine-hydrolysing)
MRDYVGELYEILVRAVQNSTADLKKGIDKVAIPFSGGLDSSVIAKLVSECIDIKLYTVGVPNCYDIKIAEQSAKTIEFEWVKIELSEPEIYEGAKKVGELLGSKNLVEIAFELPLYFTAMHVLEPMIISGQGADEAFGGYYRYTKFTPELLAQALIKDLDDIVTSGKYRDLKIVTYFGKKLGLPFLDDAVVAFAKNLPVQYKLNGGERKVILRALARAIGLPEVIVMRPKKAVQFGTGIWKVLTRGSKT